MCLPIIVLNKSIMWKCEACTQKKYPEGKKNPCFPFFARFPVFPSLFMDKEQPQSKMPRDRKSSRVIVVVYRIMEIRWEVKATAVGG